MKTESQNKAKTLKIILSVTIAITGIMLMDVACYITNKLPPPFFLDAIILFVGSVTFFRILDEEVEDDEDHLNNRNLYLTWSLLTGPCTWEEASQLAIDRGDNWRLPTVSELLEMISNQEDYQEKSSCLLWTKNKNKILSVHGDYQLMPPNSKAYFYLVSEI